MLTTSITPETTVGDIVRESPARSRIFENLKIDYCCGGKVSLAEACGAKGLDPATVVSMLNALDGIGQAPQANPDTMSIPALCDHIVAAHHDYLRNELPRLDFMTRKVAAVHGDHEPRLVKVREVFEGFQTEIQSHLQEEESAIFPAIRQVSQAQGNREALLGGLRDSLQKLENEHQEAGSALASFNELTDGYTPPEWACNTFRALYDGLAQLEKDMHQHVHKENNILFPRVLAMAEQSGA